MPVKQLRQWEQCQLSTDEIDIEKNHRDPICPAIIRLQEIVDKLATIYPGALFYGGALRIGILKILQEMKYTVSSRHKNCNVILLEVFHRDGSLCRHLSESAHDSKQNTKEDPLRCSSVRKGQDNHE